MATDPDASTAGFTEADVGDCDVSGLTPSDPDVYTEPQVRDRIRAEIYCGDKGGDPGEWSARKAQLTVQRYEAQGGGYTDEGEFDESQKDLMVWTEQDWTYDDEGGPRYFPDDFWDELSEEEKKAVSETKKEATKEGKQFASLPDEVSEKFKEWREENRDKYLEEARENPEGESSLIPGSSYFEDWLSEDGIYEGGEPKVFYRGSVGREDFPEPVFLTTDPQIASEYASRAAILDAGLEEVAITTPDMVNPDQHDVPISGQQVIPVVARASRLADLRDLPPELALMEGHGTRAPTPGLLEDYMAKFGVDITIEEEFLPDYVFLPPDTSPYEGISIYFWLEELGLYRELEEAGYDGAVIEDASPTGSSHDTFVIFDREDVRPVLEGTVRRNPDPLRDLRDRHEALRVLSSLMDYLRSLDARRGELIEVQRIPASDIGWGDTYPDLSFEITEEGNPSLDPKQSPGEKRVITIPALPDFMATMRSSSIISDYLEEHGEHEGWEERVTEDLILDNSPSRMEEDKEAMLENMRKHQASFVHEFQHLLDDRRIDVGVMEAREDFPEEEELEEGIGQLQMLLQYRNDPIETNAFVQGLLARIEKEHMQEEGWEEDFPAESFPEFVEMVEEDEEERGMYGLLNEGNRRALVRRLWLYWTEILEPQLEASGMPSGSLPSSGEEEPRENAPEDRYHLSRGERFTDPDDFITGFSGEGHNTLTKEGTEGAKFRQWFGDWLDEDAPSSVVTEEDGSPLLLYHGTTNGGFNKFMVGAELRKEGSPGVFFTTSRQHASTYSGSKQDIVPQVVGPADITEPSMGYEVEVVRKERRAYEAVEDGEVVDTVLESNYRRFPEALEEHEAQGRSIRETTVDRYIVEHRGMVVLEGGTEAEKIAAIDKIVQEANARAEIPPGQEKGIMAAYLNIRNPLVLDYEGETWQDPPEDIPFFDIDDASRHAKRMGYDGLIAKNIVDPGPRGRFIGEADEYIVFNADQVAVQGARSDHIAIPRSETDPRLNPPAESTVDVPGGPSYTVEPEDVVLSENRSYEKLSREKVAAPPKEAREAAQRARKWKEKGADGMHETGLRRMLQIAAGYQLSPAEIENVRDWFSKKDHEQKYHNEDAVEDGDADPAASLTSWWGWGGDRMQEWAESKMKEMPDRVKLTEEARENPGERSIQEAFGDVPDDPGPPEAGDLDFDLVQAVDYPVTGTDTGFELRAESLGDTYAYGFTRRPDFDGEEYDTLAELGWIQVEDSQQGEGVGRRLLADTLRFLASTGATHVAVRPLSEEASGLNEAAEREGLWHLAMEGSEGMEMYAIDIEPSETGGAPDVVPADLEWNAGRDDIEDAIRQLYSPSSAVVQSGPQPTEERPYTYLQGLRPPSAAGNLNEEYNRDVEVYESFRDAPGITSMNGYLFRTSTPIRIDDLTRTSAEADGIDSRTWSLVNAVDNYQGGPAVPEFAIVNRDRGWVMEILQGEGAQQGKTLLRFSRAGNRRIETHQHNSIYDALEETMRFVDAGESVEYLPLEYVDAALDNFERENPEGFSQETVAEATRALAYSLRRDLWDRGIYRAIEQEATEEILQLADEIESGSVPVDPEAYDPIPYHEIPSGVKTDIISTLSDLGDMRKLSEYGTDEVLPDIEEGMEAQEFAPFETEGAIDLARKQFPEARSWQSAHYLLPDGTALNLGAARSRADHRSVYLPQRVIPEYLQSGKAYEDMLALMEAGAIRLLPSAERLGIDTHTELTEEQEAWVRQALLSQSPPERVTVDVQRPGEGPNESSSFDLSPLPRKVNRRIREFYQNGPSKPVTARPNPRTTLSEMMADRHGTWRHADPSSPVSTWGVHWIMPEGQCLGGREVHDSYSLPEGHELTESPEADLLEHGAVKVKMATYDAVDPIIIETRSGFTQSQELALRQLVDASGASRLHATFRPRPGSSMSGSRVQTESVGRALEAAREHYGVRDNPDGDPAYVLAVGEAESANLQHYKPDSQRLVTMRPTKYLKHVRRQAEKRSSYKQAQRSITRESVAVSPKRIEEMKERMRGRLPIDAMWLDVLVGGSEGQDSPVVGQEGRHRAIAAKELGIEHVPVILYAHERREDAGMFGGPANVKVSAEGREFPEIITAGAETIRWPEEPTATKELWRESRFGAEATPEV